MSQRCDAVLNEFSRTKRGANMIANDLVKVGIEAQAIHGNKSQNARQLALNNFKEGKTRVLVATDIAARGIDVDELSHVINFDLPEVPETYVHRIGRTGRAGQKGVALSFCDEEEVDYLKGIENLIGKEIPLIAGDNYRKTASSRPVKGRDYAIGMRLPFYMEQLGLHDIYIRMNDKVMYVNPNTQDYEAIVQDFIEINGWDEPISISNEEILIEKFMSRGLDRSEAENYIKKQGKITEFFKNDVSRKSFLKVQGLLIIYEKK